MSSKERSPHQGGKNLSNHTAQYTAYQKPGENIAFPNPDDMALADAKRMLARGKLTKAQIVLIMERRGYRVSFPRDDADSNS